MNEDVSACFVVEGAKASPAGHNSREMDSLCTPASGFVDTLRKSRCHDRHAYSKHYIQLFMDLTCTFGMRCYISQSANVHNQDSNVNGRLLGALDMLRMIMMPTTSVGQFS